MKIFNRRVFFFVFLLTFTFNFAFSQGEIRPFSIINIIRTNSTINCITDIIIANQREFNLPQNSVVKYKIYSEGEIQITVRSICGSKQISLKVKQGTVYYLKYHKTNFEIISSTEGVVYTSNTENLLKFEENIEYPINKASIEEEKKEEEKHGGQGTCFLISSEGYFITNYHCIENATEITVKGIDEDFSSKYGVTVIASDPTNDLTLLKINNKNIKFKAVPMGIRSSGVSTAEKIYALGYPNAQIMGNEIKITEGIISSKSGAQGDVSKFQISAAVNHGNSGGPLIDESGNLVGVIFAKSTVAESAGYAIKASYLELFLKNIDGFVYPTFINTIQNKSLPDKVKELQSCIFIIESK